jgi:nucleotide-binding universal stress UspA family protein
MAEEPQVTRFPMQCVVVPIDFSESSNAGIATALQLVAKPSDVHVVYVVLPSSTYSPAGEWAPLPPGEHLGDDAERRLADYAKEHDFDGVTLHVEFGDPGTAIADYAAKQRAGLIVIASHGYHGFKRLMLGSVTENLIRHCQCAILVLHRHAEE